MSSANPDPPKATASNSLLGGLRRWVVEHPGWIAILTALLLLGLGFAQARLTNARYVEWSREHGTSQYRPGQTELEVWTYCVIGWHVLHRIFVAHARWMAGTRLVRSNYHALVRRRLVERQPIPRGKLAAYGTFGAIGFVLTTVLMLKMVESWTWLRSMEKPSSDSKVMPLFILLSLWLSGRLIWSVFSQAELHLPEGKAAQEIAAAVLEAEQDEVAAVREEAKKSVVGLPAVIFTAGLLGGLALSLRLPEAQQNSAMMSGVIGFELGALTMYLAQTRPWGRWMWQGLALVASVAGVSYVWRSFVRTEWFIVAGLLWGAALGVAVTMAYVRKLRRNSSLDSVHPGRNR